MERAQQPKKEDIASRLINRIFRRSSRRTKSTASAAAVEAQPTIPEASASTAPAPPAQSPQQPQSSTAAVETTASPPVRDTTPVVQWTNVQQERARILFAKYGLTLEPNEWMTPRNLEVRRVDKPIRMRVRRTCHRCQTSFGPDKVCVNCQHVRCKQCPRYPPARTKEEKEARALAKAKAKAEASSEAAAADNSKQQQQQNEPLTLPSRSGGQDVTYKDIKQRVRRTCHRCQTHFQGISTQCENCGHTRCKICPRDPAKLDKYPDGYPGDEDPPLERPIRVWKKPRMRVRYYCHKCDTAYVPGEPTCRNCGQEKGPETKRYPPKKEKPSVDPELLRRVQERLGVIRINEGDDT